MLNAIQAKAEFENGAPPAAFGRDKALPAERSKLLLGQAKIGKRVGHGHGWSFRE